ncbi:hypothetical protein A0H81_08650 [Grifola frondosa]|uniref:Uncharacterized protein n=1 Tax=Grifola frondosa TaxID=5627 RepID=A0A1C7M3V7_GRIFR|nr:hypothetical protein A0H81_08650 [Grifola frondosa]
MLPVTLTLVRWSGSHSSTTLTSIYPPRIGYATLRYLAPPGPYRLDIARHNVKAQSTLLLRRVWLTPEDVLRSACIFDPSDMQTHTLLKATERIQQSSSAASTVSISLRSCFLTSIFSFSARSWNLIKFLERVSADVGDS